MHVHRSGLSAVDPEQAAEELAEACGGPRLALRHVLQIVDALREKVG
jgi:hypothetical protein